jgi:hypothetical protein
MSISPRTGRASYLGVEEQGPKEGLWGWGLLALNGPVTCTGIQEHKTLLQAAWGQSGVGTDIPENLQSSPH